MTGTAVLLATGKISTVGGGQALTTADPTGAKVLMLAGSSDAKAVSLQQKDATFTGTMVATATGGGVVIGSSNSLYRGSLVGQTAVLGGSGNTLDGR